ncbi:hypothetical protein NQZ68_027552 [Dissostichus eleginoides]|nr:hypothetical protein NQZ68_027552 [Dissostichus eleginoides]
MGTGFLRTERSTSVSAALLRQTNFAKMNIGCVILACTLLVGASSGSKAGPPLKPPCRPGFSQNFYTVIVPRDAQHGQSILKDTTLSSERGKYRRRRRRTHP